MERKRAEADPVWWVEHRLKCVLWSKQREIMRSLRDHKKTAVHSCFDSGKSFIGSRAACWWIEKNVPGDGFVVTSAPTMSQVRAILWREIARAHSLGKLAGRTNQTEWWLKMKDGHEEMVALGRKPSDMDPAAFQGIRAKNMLVIFDEAAGIPKPLWVAAESLTSNEGGRFLAIGNPDDSSGEFAEVCKPGSGWNVIRIDALETPAFTDEAITDDLRSRLVSKEWVEDKRARWGEANPLWISRVRGLFPVLRKDGLIPQAAITAAQQRELPRGLPNELGVDVGAGGDKNVQVHRRGGWARVIRRDQVPDTMRSCGHLVQALRETGASRAKVDEIGVGRGLVDRAKEGGHPVVGINVSGPAKGALVVEKGEHRTEQFVNLRAEGYWELRERFLAGDIDIDPRDDDLAAQLVDLRFFVTSSGKIQIESKDEIRRRAGRSPDEADALMLAFLDPPPTERPKPKAGLVW